LKYLLRIIFIFTCLLYGASVFSQALDTEYSEGVAYISGGVGDEESTAILSEAKRWPLMLELSQIENGRGIWIFGATVKLVNSSQKVVFNAQANGPYMLINIEPGEYSLQASYQGVEQKRAISLKAGQSQKLSIFWK